MPRTEYLIALGSNQRHHRYQRPRDVLHIALQHLDTDQLSVKSVSPIMESRPIGPSNRTYANAAAIIESDLSPPDLLTRLKECEAEFGRRRGQRWSSRTLDLDIIAWSKGAFCGSCPALCIPHPDMRVRGFVLRPASKITPGWRDPISGLTIRHLVSRLNRPKPLDPKQKRR